MHQLAILSLLHVRSIYYLSVVALLSQPCASWLPMQLDYAATTLFLTMLVPAQRFSWPTYSHVLHSYLDIISLCYTLDWSYNQWRKLSVLCSIPVCYTVILANLCNFPVRQRQTHFTSEKSLKHFSQCNLAGQSTIENEFPRSPELILQ